MTTREPWQVADNEAGIYESQFVPALFSQWAPRILDAAGVGDGDSILDVATGTGIVARTAAARVGDTGSVTGYDLNATMLAVAEKIAPELTWLNGPAESMPFDDGQFDAVTCQFGLMFFDNRQSALMEMYRVLKKGGRLAVAVWDSLECTPAYEKFVALLDDIIGVDAGNMLRAPFVLGDPKDLISVFLDASLPDPTLKTLPGSVHFDSIRTWVGCDVKATPISRLVDDAAFGMLLLEAENVLAEYADENGAVVFDSPAHIVSVTKF